MTPNLYNADGTLTGSRTVSQSTNNLTFSGTGNLIKTGGNIGIGNASPNAPLQFATEERSRKIVLWENGNNDHQFFGFGINNGILRYQINTTTDNHVFYTGTSTTTSSELMRIQGNGNVGIGTVPSTRFHTTGGVRFQGLAGTGSRMVITDANGVLSTQTIPATGTNLYNADGTLTGSRIVSQGVNNLNFASTATSGTSRFTVDGSTFNVDAVNNRIGINTNAPLLNLDITGSSFGLKNSNSGGSWDHIFIGHDSVFANLTAGGAEGGLRFRVGQSVTGFYNDSSQNYVTAMTMLPSGNVGVGTISPSTQLHTTGGVRFQGLAGTGSRMVITDPNGVLSTQTIPTGGTNLYNSDGTLTESRTVSIGTSQIEFKGTTAASMRISANNSQSARFGLATGAGQFGLPRAGDFIIQNMSSTAGLSFGTNGDNNRMYINNVGNVGIGTSSANAPLHFANDIRNRKIVLWEGANNDHQFNGFGMNYGFLRYQVNNTGDSHVFFAGTSASTSNEIMRIQGNGNVGIGTSSANAPLHFANDIRNRKIVLWEGANNDHQFYGFGINGGVLRYQTMDNHIFYNGTSATNSTELMRIQGNNGNVGINTNGSASSRLSVGGGIAAHGNNSITEQGAHIQWNNSGGEGETWIINHRGLSNNNYGIRFGATSGGAITEMARFNASGSLLIGTATESQKLTVNGHAAKSVGGTAWATFSDMRLKENVSFYKRGLNEILAINPIYYNYTENSGKSNKDSKVQIVGISAQELQKAIPDAITIVPKYTMQDGTVLNDVLELTQADAIWLATINAIKELNQKIEKLEQQNATLQASNDLMLQTLKDMNELKAEMLTIKKDLQKIPVR